MARLLLLAAFVLATASPVARALEATDAPPAAPATSPGAPQDLLWPGVVVIVVVAIFATAALAGPLIRANTDDDLPGEGNDPPTR